MKLKRYLLKYSIDNEGYQKESDNLSSLTVFVKHKFHLYRSHRFSFNIWDRKRKKQVKLYIF